MLNILRNFIFLYLVVSLCASKILFMMPHPALSHQIVARSLTKTLARNGEVVVITPRPAFTAGNNITEVDVSDSETLNSWNNALANITGKRSDNYHTEYLSYLTALKTFTNQLKKTKVKKIFQEKFDLVVAENIFRSTVALSRVCNAPLVHFGTIGTSFVTDFEGSLTHYLYYPHVLRIRIHNLSFWEVLTQFYDNFYYQIGFELLILKDEKETEEVFPFQIDDDLKKNVQMSLLNTNALWEGNRPKSFRVIYVEGFHKPQQEEISQQLKDYLNSSTHGVIYVSFGTSVINSRLPRERIIVMVRVLAQMPYDVVWKWDGELPESADNIKVFKWLSQATLLKHPKIKLFITQAGIHSTEEAINAGVPLLGLPLVADQWYNAEKYAYFKIGERLDLHDLTVESFKNAVETIINDETYRHNIARLRVLIADQPLTPEERVAWAIQRARRLSAGAWMRAPSAHMSVAEYYELQLVFAVLLAVTFIAVFIVFAIRRLWAKIRNYVSLNLKSKTV